MGEASFKKPIRFQVTLELEPWQRDLLRREGVYDPTNRESLRLLARVALNELLDEWAMLEMDDSGESS